MKKIVFVMLLVFIAMQSASFAALEDKKLTSGLLFLDLPVLSMVHHDANKQVTSFTGVNGGLGLSHRMYFEPLKTKDWNMSWEIGTIFLLLPYIGVGADYVWDNGWYLGIGTIYIIPYPRAGIFF